MSKCSILPAVIILAACFFITSCRQKPQQGPAKAPPKEAVVNTKSGTIVNSSKWIGDWERRSWHANAGLDITAISNDSLTFTLSSSEGGHTGEIEGKAYLNNTSAIFKDNEGNSCKLTMRLKGNSIIVEDNNSCLGYGGMGVGFSGTFVNRKFLPKEEKETLTSLNILTPHQDLIFRKLVDTGYQHFVDCTELIADQTGEKYLDSFPAKVIESGVRGLYTFMEYVIMVDENDHFWAAIINDDKVYYYTNNKNYVDKLPKTIEDWRSRFKDYPVTFVSKSQ